MREQRVGKLWIRTDPDGSRYFGGVILADLPRGAHIRIRRNHEQQQKRDGEYLVYLVDEAAGSDPEPGLEPQAKRARGAYDPGSIASFHVSDEEWNEYQREMERQ